MPTPTHQAPLGRSAGHDILDWPDVEPRPRDAQEDVLGLRPDDRAALGMSGARTIDLAHAAHGDAAAALVEALATGGPVPKFEKKHRG